MPLERLPHRPARSLLAFEDFTLDLARGVLTAEAREVVLRPKTAAVLAHLLAHAGAVVSREALLGAVWGDVAVTDDSLTQCISEIRRALGARGTSMLQTLPRRGYLLATQLRPAEALPPIPNATPPPTPFATLPPPPPAPRIVPWLALAVGATALTLSAITLLGRAPAPSPAALPTPQAAPPTPSPRSLALRLLAQGRTAQHGSGPYEARMRASLPLFYDALEVEPGLVEAATEAVFVLTELVLVNASRDRAQDLREAARLAALAMAAEPGASHAQQAQAAVLRQLGRFAEAIAFYERAGADPARIAARANVGVMHLMLGAAEPAQPPLRAVLLERPMHPLANSWRVYLGLAKLLAGQPDEAADDFLTQRAPGGFFPVEERMLYRLAALAGAGRLAEAEALDADLRQQFAAPLARPLRALGLSDEARYLARFETAVLAPLRQKGWVEAGR